MMKCIVALLFLVGCSYGFVVQRTNFIADADWHLWKAANMKTYSDFGEEKVRYAIWQNNMQRITEHNAAGVESYTLGMNKFGDLTGREFAAGFGLFQRRNASVGSTFLAPSNLQEPTTVDWRTKGYVTAIKNQGQCGSCWAFSTTGSLEGQYFKKTGTLIPLSEQQLVDCSKQNNGCEGGLMDYAFEYIESKGIESEADYPYTGEDGHCKYDASKIVTKVTGYTDVTSGSESALKSAVASIGPVSVAIDASHYSFQLYKDGVYNERLCSSSRLDHGVLAVGYGTHSGKDYWLVKNSWGTGWGMSGYIMMSRNKSNQCGIATSASYPLL